MVLDPSTLSTMLAIVRLPCLDAVQYVSALCAAANSS